MATTKYVEALRGYIADVPRVVFRRCDGHAYAFTELTAATVTANVDPMEIRAGWSLFPVAVLPGTSTFEMSFTSGQFDAEIFSMANKVDFKANSNYELDTSERVTVNATTHKATLENTPIADTVYIEGMEPTTEETIASGKYKLSDNELTFSADDDIDYLTVCYKYTKAVQEAIITNKESAIGECSCIWPVYDSGDDCSQSAIIGYYVIKVFRARITQIPGMDTSYRTAATYQFSLQALDAKRGDEGAYSAAYFRNETSN